MKRFLLVPSPFLPLTSWRPTAEALAARGHAATILDLSGLLDAEPSGYRRVADAAGRYLADPMVVVAHSGAGALLPSIADAWRSKVVGAIFVDALLPHPGKSWMQTVSSETAERLRQAVVEGRVPPWPTWLPPATLERLLPDASARTDLIRTAPRVPLSYLDEVAPSPSIWLAAGQCAYLQLSEVYASEAAEARRLGWRTAHLEADHLAIMTRAEAVAERIAALADELELAATSPTE